MTRPDAPAGPGAYDADLVVSAGGLLATFNRAGVLNAADVHVASRLAELGSERDDRVALAAALAVRAPRVGHVFVDLETVRTMTADEDQELDLGSLPWPDPTDWVGRLATSPLVTAGEDGPEDRPLRLVGTALYLDRFWRDERSVAEGLKARVVGDAPEVDEAVLSAGLVQLFPDASAPEPRWAAATAVVRRLSVIAGGPGSGKTTTVARIAALLDDQARVRGRRPPLIGLVAPTGKAAARLEEAVHAEALRLDLAAPVRQRLLSARAATLHRLLGARPDSASRFRHHRLHRLPHDVVIVDETSMVSLSLMARLIEAVRSDARLVLVGDPEQLASVEAGAVLGDIVGPSLTGLRMSPAAAAQLERITGMAPGPRRQPPEPGGSVAAVEAAGVAGDGVVGHGVVGDGVVGDGVVAASTPVEAVEPAGAVGDSVVVLRTNYRFRGALAELADAIRSGAADRVVALLSGGDPSLRWVEVEDADDWSGEAAGPRLEPIRAAVNALGTALLEAATTRNGEGALEALGGFRVLCAHRRGPSGVSSWTDRIEGWLSAALPECAAGRAWYLGRPVMVTANDYGLRLFNGDTGVVLPREDGGVAVTFRQAGSLVAISPARLSSVQTVFAMTVHKAQGSEFSRVAVILPPSTSAVLTRELLYTAVTRAQEGLLLAGSELAIRAAVWRPIARASGLTQRLWGSPDRDSGSLHLAG